LVAVATVGIALVLVVYVVTSDKKDQVKEGFPLAKEVLTSLIGVLGTIVGFYFGSTTGSPTTTAAEQQPAVTTAQPSSGSQASTPEKGSGAKGADKKSQSGAPGESTKQ